MRSYSGSGGGGGGGANSHDHRMMISMDGSSSSPPPTTTSNNNININRISDDADHHNHQSPSGGGGGGAGNSMLVLIEREHMFDKVVTPSDVGKLNRLVIPKQHAEKYFPLDSSTNENGLLLNFEDRNGKPWRFRYSYWNSSQSYVMTKGWSRFVKEKKLDAGDIVSFQRGLGELGKDRLFIDWRRRPDAPSPPLPPYNHHHHHPSIPSLSVPSPIYSSHHQLSFHPWNHPYYNLQHPPSREQYSHFQPYNYESHPNSSRGGGVYGYGGRNPCSGSIIYLNRSSTAAAGGGGGGAARMGGVGMGMRTVQKGSGSSHIRGMIHEDEDEAMVFESVPVVQGKAAAKRLRLFGVNMDCPISDEEVSDDHHPEISDQCDILSSTAVPLSSTTLMASHSSSISHLRPYNVITTDHNINGTPMILQTMPTHDLLNKGKAASMSLDLDI